jgi:hypothetical protein
MPDMEVLITHIEEVIYEIERPELLAGTRLRIVINDSNVIFDKTVPAGKKLVNAQLTISGAIADE